MVSSWVYMLPGIFPYVSNGLEFDRCSGGWRPNVGDREGAVIKLSAALVYVVMLGQLLTAVPRPDVDLAQTVYLLQ
jgi:hypothetical protein